MEGLPSEVRSNIFIAGHQGMVGSAIVRALKDKQLIQRTRSTLDLRDQVEVTRFLREKPPSVIYLAAARVGGIQANTIFPAEFIYENLMIESNVIHASHAAGVQNLLFLGSSCIYPRSAAQPIREEALLTGPLEPTNEPYAIAKIAGIKLCESYNRQFGRDYRSVMPTNLYGPNDNFHPYNSHVIPGMMLRFHNAVVAGAREVVIWGSGKPLREFLHVDDLAAACIYVMSLPQTLYEKHNQPMLSHINVGSGIECSIRDLAETIARVTGFRGRLLFDTSKPDGTPRKLLDSSKLKSMGWQPRIGLEEGLQDTYEWFLNNQEFIRT